MRRVIALVALTALLTAACKIETNFGMVISADGSATIILEVGMDEEAQGFFLQDGADPFEDQDLPDLGWSPVREERRGDMTFWIRQTDVADVTALGDELAGDAASMLDDFRVTVTSDRVTVQGSASADDAFGGGEGFDPRVFEESISANIRITMPGLILSHNATSRRDNELTWAVPVLGSGLEIHAESDPTQQAAGEGGGLTTAIIIGVAALAAAGGAFLFMRRKEGGGMPEAVVAEGMPPPKAPSADE